MPRVSSNARGSIWQVIRDSALRRIGKRLLLWWLALLVLGAVAWMLAGPAT
jgi:hypothetical protein